MYSSQNISQPYAHTCASVSGQLVDMFGWIEGEGENRVVVTARKDEAMWVFVIRGHTANTADEILVPTHEVTLSKPIATSAKKVSYKL